MSPAKSNAKQNNLKPLLLVGGLVLTGAFVYMNYFDAEPNSFGNPISTTKTNSESSSPKGEVAEFKKPTPTKIDKSIDRLATDIIESSPNQQEGYAALVEAKSYRVQKLRTRRAEAAEKEAQAKFNAALLTYKKTFIPELVAKEISSEEKSESNRTVKSESGKYRNHNLNKTPEPVNEKETFDLADFKLRAIVEDGSNSLMARLAFKGRKISAKAGDSLIGSVNVASVSSEKVVLTKDDDSLSLYAY